MISAKEIKVWIDTLNPNSFIAIDDGGLMLVNVTPSGIETGACLEIGGIPEEETGDSDLRPG